METNAAQNETFMDVEELSTCLKMSDQAIRDMAKRGEIPHYKGKGRTSPYRFLLSEVKEALKRVNVSGVTQ